MNIGNSTNNDQEEELEPANENAMYKKSAVVGLSSPLLNTSAYEYNITDVDHSATHNLTEREKFYRSYDPKVGLHTAAVLGGILAWVILYLFYRTKLKKAVIHFFRKKTKKDKVFVEKEVMRTFMPSVVESNLGMHEPFNRCVNQKFFGKDFLFDQLQASIECQKLIVNEHNYSPTTDDQHSKWNQSDLPSPVLVSMCNVSSPSAVDLDQGRQHRPIQHLPSVETDIVKATAQWVHDQPLSSQSASFQDISGVILKVQPHMFHNQVPGSCPLDTMLCRHQLTPIPMPQSWNKSMPVLTENLHVSSEQLNREQKADYKTDKKGRSPPKLTIPIPDIREFSSNTRLANSPVPIPVTPTVMIQNFTSKGNAKNSPLQRTNSNDSMTSNSSEDPLLNQSQVQVGWQGKNMLIPPKPKDMVGSSNSTQLNTSQLHPIIKIDSMETRL